MNRSKLIRLAAGLLFGCAALAASAQHALEIIVLRHRTVDQVLPVLRPLLEPGGTLSGQYSQLIVRASPANVAELKRVLEAIDRPLRRLQISVRFEDSLDAARQGIEGSGAVSNRGPRIELRAEDSRTRADERVDQSLQVLEGARAVIYGGVQYRATGFEVVPRLSGESVLMDISPQRESGDSFQHAAATVSARLGEWFEVAGTATSSSRDARGILSTSRSAIAEGRRVWLKVEEIRN